MNSLTSRDRVRIAEEMIPPRAGLPGILAAPVPHDEALRQALACLPAGDIPRLLDVIAYHRLDGLAHRAVSRLPQDSIDPWLRSSLKRRSQRLAAATLSQALALADILESIRELQYYREAVFVPPPGPDTATAREIATRYGTPGPAVAPRAPSPPSQPARAPSPDGRAAPTGETGSDR